MIWPRLPYILGPFGELKYVRRQSMFSYPALIAINKLSVRREMESNVDYTT